MLAKKTSKNQVTLPKEIATQFPDIDYFDVAVKESSIILTPVRISSASLTTAGIREKMERLGITDKDVRNAVQWARGRRK